MNYLMRLGALVSIPVIALGCSVKATVDAGHHEVDDACRLAIDASNVGRQWSVSSSRNTPWELIHAALGLTLDGVISDENGQYITLKSYFDRGGPFLGSSIYRRAESGVLMKTAPWEQYLERHPDQFLAYFAILGVPLANEFSTSDDTFTLEAMLAAAKHRFDPALETSFSLIAFATYLRADARWANRDGQDFTTGSIADIELSKRLDKLSCGGTHSLFGLQVALRKLEGLAIRPDALCSRIRLRLDEAIRRAAQLQLDDGSISPGTLSLADDEVRRDPLGAKVFSTGHSLEWILAYRPEERTAPWVRRAIVFLATAVCDPAIGSSSFGPRFHALHALREFRAAIVTDNPD